MWTIFLYLAAILCSCSQSVLTKRNASGNGNAAAFNFLKSAGFLLILLVIFAFDCTANVETLAYGAIYGCFLALSSFCGYYALREGPMSLTSMLVTFSLILPCAYGVIVLHERPSIPQYVGLALFFVSLFLIRSPSLQGEKNDGPTRKLSKKWVFFTTTTLLSNGCFAIVQKLHQTRYPGLYAAEFTVCAATVNLLVFGLLFLVAYRRRKKAALLPAETPKQNDRPAAVGKLFSASLITGAIAGSFGGAFNFCQVRLAATENAAILYPVLSAGIMLAVFLAGRFLLKERMTKLQMLGFAVGVCSVVLLKI